MFVERKVGVQLQGATSTHRESGWRFVSSAETPGVALVPLFAIRNKEGIARIHRVQHVPLDNAFPRSLGAIVGRLHVRAEVDTSPGAAIRELVER